MIKQVRHILKTQKPAAFVAVDFYGLNHQFLKVAKEENIPAYYYVAPQVWASRQYRAKQLAALAGYNRVSADSGSVTVKYKADSSLAYAELESNLTNAVLSLGAGI